MADGYGLTGSSGGRRWGRRLYSPHTPATGKPTANLLGSVQLSPGERAGPGDESTRAVIIWSLSLK